VGGTADLISKLTPTRLAEIYTEIFLLIITITLHKLSAFVQQSELFRLARYGVQATSFFMPGLPGPLVF